MMATPCRYMMSSWNEESAKTVVTVITNTDSEGLMRHLLGAINGRQLLEPKL